jgi:integrase/recombinase XerD
MDAGVKQSLPLPDSDVLTVFAEFLRLNVAAGDASPQTVRNYAGQARAFFQWALDAGLDPRAASERDLQAYRRYLVEQDYAPGTIAFKLAVVRRLYDALVWRGVRADNPAAGLKAPKDRTAPEERVSYLPLEGLRRLLAAPDAETVQGRRDRAILALMGRHGLRVGEVAALDLEAWDAGAGDWGAMAVVGKGNKRRTIYLTEGTARALDAWAEVRADVAQPEAPALFVATRGGGRSRRPPGTRLTTRAIRSVVDGYLEDVGLKAEGVSCHSLRHSAATWARFGGAKLDAIGDMLGHSKPETTMVYAKIVNKMQENPAVFLDAVLGDVEG